MTDLFGLQQVCWTDGLQGELDSGQAIVTSFWLHHA